MYPTEQNNHVIVIPEGVEILYFEKLTESSSFGFIELPSSLQELTPSCFHQNPHSITVVCKAINPPTMAGSFYNYNPITIYVPDDSVNAYKQASRWDYLSSRIYPLSEYAG